MTKARRVPRYEFPPTLAPKFIAPALPEDENPQATGEHSGASPHTGIPPPARV